MEYLLVPPHPHVQMLLAGIKPTKLNFVMRISSSSFASLHLRSAHRVPVHRHRITISGSTYREDLVNLYAPKPHAHPAESICWFEAYLVSNRTLKWSL